MVSSTRSTTSWAMPVAGGDCERVLAVAVQQQNAELAAIAGVDQARGVHEPYPVPGGEPRARYHQTCVALGDRDGYARAHAGAFAGGDRGRLGGVQVEAGIAVARPLRACRLREAPERKDHAR